MVRSLQRQSHYQKQREGLANRAPTRARAAASCQLQMALPVIKALRMPAVPVALARKRKTTHLVNCMGGERKRRQICCCCWELGFRTYFPKETIFSGIRPESWESPAAPRSNYKNVTPWVSLLNTVLTCCIQPSTSSCWLGVRAARTQHELTAQ